MKSSRTEYYIYDAVSKRFWTGSYWRGWSDITAARSYQSLPAAKRNFFWMMGTNRWAYVKTYWDALEPTKYKFGYTSEGVLGTSYLCATRYQILEITHTYDLDDIYKAPVYKVATMKAKLVKGRLSYTKFDKEFKIPPIILKEGTFRPIKSTNYMSFTNTISNGQDIVASKNGKTYSYSIIATKSQFNDKGPLLNTFILEIKEERKGPIPDTITYSNEVVWDTKEFVAIIPSINSPCVTTLRYDFEKSCFITL